MSRWRTGLRWLRSRSGTERGPAHRPGSLRLPGRRRRAGPTAARPRRRRRPARGSVPSVERGGIPGRFAGRRVPSNLGPDPVFRPASELAIALIDDSIGNIAIGIGPVLHPAQSQRRRHAQETHFDDERLALLLPGLRADRTRLNNTAPGGGGVVALRTVGHDHVGDYPPMDLVRAASAPPPRKAARRSRPGSSALRRAARRGTSPTP
jgi:hypothetical protein